MFTRSSSVLRFHKPLILRFTVLALRSMSYHSLHSTLFRSWWRPKYRAIGSTTTANRTKAPPSLSSVFLRVLLPLLPLFSSSKCSRILAASYVERDLLWYRPREELDAKPRPSNQQTTAKALSYSRSCHRSPLPRFWVCTLSARIFLYDIIQRSLRMRESHWRLGQCYQPHHVLRLRVLCERIQVLGN